MIYITAVYKILRHHRCVHFWILKITIMFILLAINAIMFSVVPDYTTYRDLYYCNNSMSKIKKCNDIEKDETKCGMSIVLTLLLEFHYKAWIFGAAYYHLTWLFLIVIVVGAVYKMYEMRKMSQIGSLLEEEEEIEDDPDSILSRDTNTHTNSPC